MAAHLIYIIYTCLQEMIASTQNEPMRRRPILPEEHAILTLNDPYISVTQKDHRHFTKQELEK